MSDNGIPAPPTPPNLGVRERQRLLAQKIYDMVRALGPDCTLAQIRNHAAEEGIEVGEDQWRYARRKAFPERFPAHAKSRPAPTSAATAIPTDTRTAQEIVSQLRAATRLLRATGTLAEARLMLDAAAELAQEDSP